MPRAGTEPFDGLRVCWRCHEKKKGTAFDHAAEGRRRKRICSECVSSGRITPTVVCTACGVRKSESQFDLDVRGGVRMLRSQCRECRHAQRRRRMGIMECDVAAMLIAQDHKCAICSILLVTSRSSKGSRDAMVVDHDHSTGVVRGLLCRQCNVGIGNLKDDHEIVESAARYLRFGFQKKEK